MQINNEIIFKFWLQKEIKYNMKFKLSEHLTDT